MTRDELIEWARGADIDALDPADRTKPRLVMGDPLHARPATVIYGGSEDDPDMVLFTTTNDGYLHAIDPDDGRELWSYIPGHLLRRMTDLYLDKAQNAKRYGLDGSLRRRNLGGVNFDLRRLDQRFGRFGLRRFNSFGRRRRRCFGRGRLDLTHGRSPEMNGYIHAQVTMAALPIP